MGKRSTLIDWEIAGRPAPGETESGDLHTVVPFEGGTIVAVVDGLGHGSEARLAAGVAIDTVRDCANESVSAILQRCHKALMQNTRGAVLNLASFDGEKGAMTWLGVGNVEGVLMRADPGDSPTRRSLVTAGGVVGSRLPTLNPVTLPVKRGDLLVFATDGISQDFLADLHGPVPPNGVAERILERFGKGNDDALVLVARYVGPRR